MHLRPNRETIRSKQLSLPCKEKKGENVNNNKSKENIFSATRSADKTGLLSTSAFLPENLHYFITDFSGAVDVLDGEDTAQAVERHFGQSGNKLRRRHQNVHAVWSIGKIKRGKYLR